MKVPGHLGRPWSLDEIPKWEMDLLRQQSRDHGLGYEDARKDLRNLLRKTRDHTPSARVAAVIAWAGNDLDQMTGMSRAACRACREDIGPCVCLHDCGTLTCTAGFKEPPCTYTLDECPYDWCAVHDEVPSVVASTTYYCTPACVVGHGRQGEHCGG